MPILLLRHSYSYPSSNYVPYGAINLRMHSKERGRQGSDVRSRIQHGGTGTGRTQVCRRITMGAALILCNLLCVEGRSKI